MTRQNRFVAKGFLHNIILITKSDFVSSTCFPIKESWLASHRSVIKTFVAGGVAARNVNRAVSSGFRCNCVSGLYTN